MNKQFFREFWVMVFVILALYCLCPKMWGMGKKSLLTAQIADTVKLADRVTGIENAQLKLADKLDGQVAAVAGLNNTVSKVSTDIKAGRDANSNNVNDSQLMKEYIQAMKDAHTEVVGIMWKIIDLLILQLVGIIGSFGWYMWMTIKSLLSARDKDSESDAALIAEQMSKKEGN